MALLPTVRHLAKRFNRLPTSATSTLATAVPATQFAWWKCRHRYTVSIKWCTTGNRMLSMDSLTLFGLLAVTLMLVFYALEDRSPWYILAFAGSCLLASTYGFLQGAWPFGVVEAIWAGVAVERWWRRAS
jgi:hypothetical protein